MIDAKLERILLRVQKPARYTGGEYNEIIKDKAAVDVRFAMCFPDTYEIGMSNLGLRILYGSMNQAEGVWCERAFAPWGDMEEEMRKEHIPLYALESGDSLKEFDFVGFSLGYEMAYTNVLNMLDLAHIPLHSDQRGEDDPIIVAGGTCVYNGEPLADFIDIFSLGEGEDVTLEMIDLYRKGKQAGWSRAEFLQNAAQVPGLYVPSLYEISYHQDGTVQAITPTHGAPEHIRKRIVADLDKSYFPVKTIIPSTDIVHDRVMLEVFRGCIRGCRFCQAGYCYRPVRPKSVDLLVQQGIASCKDSGYQEMTLSSLSTSDYRPLTELCDGLLEYCDPRNININLPSLRADGFSMGIMQRLQRVRKTSITFAPEAGTQRMRDTINKNVKEEDLLQSCRTAFEGGCNAVKLYFMLGLPTETDEDVVGIAELVYKILQVWRENGSGKKRGLSINLATAYFVPKPFTPFQWAAQITPEEYLRRVHLLQANLHAKCVDYRYHESDLSRLEAVMARGDRRVGQALLEAHRLGCRLDGWDEYFDYEKWLEAFRRAGLDLDFYTTRGFAADELLPWQTIDVGVTTKYLLHEREKALRSEATPDCRTHCNGCGARMLSERRLCDESPAV